MRVSSESERIGLDMSQHGESYNFADMDDEWTMTDSCVTKCTFQAFLLNNLYG